MIVRRALGALSAVASIVASLTVASSASAQPTVAAAAAAPTTAPAAPLRIVEVRLGLSSVAAESLSEQRLRRLLEIELDDSAVLAPGTSGPLGDHVAYVWIDLPDPSRATVEVRVGERQVTRRDFSIAGLTFDIAARVVAITASEMVRSQMRPIRAPRRAPAPKGPTPDELERASRQADALTFEAGAMASFLPASGGVLGGPSMSIRLRRFGLSERLYGSWLTGPTDAGTARWFEAGLGVDYRIWLSRSWRLSLGAAASLALVHLPDVSAADHVVEAKDAWSSRATGVASIEARLHGPLWLGLTVEPGVLLRPVPYADASGAEGSIQGAWIGASLSLTIEWLSAGQPSAAR